MKGVDGKRPKKCRRCGRRVVVTKINGNDELVALAIVPGVYTPFYFRQWADAADHPVDEASLADLHEVDVEPLAFVRHDCGEGR